MRRAMCVRRIMLVLLVIPAVLGLTALPAQALTFVADSTADDTDGTCLNAPLGDCTLREAITMANTTPGTDTIVFNITGTGQHTISPTSALPTITAPVMIDGFSDPDDAGRIELDGTNAGAGSGGFVVSASGSGSTIRGFVINDFAGVGIQVHGGSTVHGNYVGTDETGLVGEGNVVGLGVFGAGNQIGGTTAGQGNVISGNDFNGMHLSGTGAVVQGNLIGSAADGSTDLGNGNNGVLISGGASNNTVGGTTAAARNVISGNTSSGVLIQSSTTTGNAILGNYIGTRASGTEALPNTVAVQIEQGANANRIGGTATGAGNLISGNSSFGIQIIGSAASGNQIEGNLIGTTSSGLSPLTNVMGIRILDAPNTMIGGGGTTGRNVISGNESHGIEIQGPTADGTRVTGNYIGLGSDGSTDVGNGGYGIRVSEASVADFLSGTAIGGTGAGEGNVISGNAQDGIRIEGGRVQDTTMRGNIIGLASDGATDRGNDGDGVEAAAAAGTTTVGGTIAAARNVVSGNGGLGLNLRGSLGTYLVQGNYVGMDAAGTAAVANAGGGASVSGVASAIGGTTGVTVGGSCTGACNLISGNTGTGLLIGSDQTIRGNYIGTDVTGLLDRGNTSNGIRSATDTTVTTVGGTVPEARNIIAGNGSFGLNWADVGASNDIIQGNYIGVGSDGTTAIGNSNSGLNLGGDNNTIGGTAAGAGNVIAFNGGASTPGVQVLSSASGNAVRGNSIHSHGGLGIDLDPVFSVNSNDDDDPDTGANEGQNLPWLATAEVAAGAVTVDGTLNSVPSSTFALDFYSSPSCNAPAPSNHGEGATYLGHLVPVITNGSGDASFTFTSSGTPAVSAGDVITATATDASGNTSEFSRCRVAVAGDSPTLSTQDTSITEGNAGTTTASFTVTLSASSPDTVTVDYATADGSATSPNDYQSASGTVTFSPGQTSKTIDVTVNGDRVDEANEAFTVTLSNAGGATISDGQVTGTITDDDTATISIADESVPEGNSGTTTATFTVSLSTESASQVTVDWSTSGGTATAGSDYQAGNGTVTLAPGDTTETIDVTVNGDTVDETNETFIVTLSNPSGASISDSEATGTITDDDAAPSISIADATVTEGNAGTATATFEVTLSTQSASQVTVDWATSDGTAMAPSDYIAGSGTVTFPPMDTSESITVTVNADTIDEGSGEAFQVTLSNPSGATISDGQAMGTITDDDAATVSIADATVTEGNSGTTAASFTVTLSTESASQVTVDWETADATATAPADYAGANGTVTFDPGQTSKTIDVAVNGDTAVEPDEAFTVTLSNPSGATIADGQAMGTIVNDDAAPPPPPPPPPSSTKCAGFESDPRPQLVGTEGADNLTGTPAAEIVCGLGANDQLKGGGGNDLVLGGGGNDRMAGQAGKDVMKGQAGNDRMNGGPGVDRCQGGPGKDAGRACEKGRA